MKLFRSLVYAALTLLIYLGMTLLGWGLGNLAGYLADAPRLAYAFGVGLFSLAIGIQSYESTEGIRGHHGQEDKFIFRQRIVRVILVLYLYLALFFIPYFDRHSLVVFEGFIGLRWLGAGLSWLGYGMIFMSGLSLGRQYSADVTIQKEHQLVSSGIYRWIRHPRYLGIILLTFGFALVFRSWIGLLAAIPVIWILLFRIRDEEQVLQTEFGSAWENYCQQSWRLVPLIF